jgi:branched-chain amino acid aminotransferase
MTLEDLATADEAFFTGTAAEVTPIREVDGVEINGGRRGPVTESIQRVFFSAVAGREERYMEWLHLVTQPLEMVTHD